MPSYSPNPTVRGPLESALAGAVIHALFWLVLIGLVVRFVPGVKKQFDDFGLQVPLLTVKVIEFSSALHGNVALILGIIAVVVVVDAAMLYALGQPTSYRVARELWSGVMVALPVAALVAATIAIVLPYQKLVEGLTENATANSAAAEREQTALAGTWTLTSLERDGQPLPREKVDPETLTVNGGQFVWKSAGEERRGSFKINLRRKPRGIELALANAPKGADLQGGLYTLVGDTLTVCLAKPGATADDLHDDLTTQGTTATKYVFTRPPPPRRDHITSVPRSPPREPLMANRLDSVPPTLLMGPGPSGVFPEVYAALAKPTLGHLDPSFIAIMDDTKTLLQQVMRTKNAVTFPVSGTGSAGMEAAFVNLVEPGDRVLVLVNGVFGLRMADVAGRLGAKVDTVEFEWGTPVLADAVNAKLAGQDYRLVAVVHAETSTGVANPVAEIAALVRPTGSLFLVDGVTSLGGIPVDLDAWGADAFYSGTQKCLSCPPGLSPFSFSDRAVAKLRARKSKVPNWYLDVSMIVNYWEGAKRAYHHTAPINMIYGLYQALQCVVGEGLENTFARHKAAHERLVAGLEKLGLEMLVAPTCRLPMLNAVKVPTGVDEALVRSKLLNEHRIEIGAGLGPLAGKVWRVGLMGHTARPQNVDRFLAALGTVL